MRQKTAALQKLAPTRTAFEIREAFWSAAVLCRFGNGLDGPSRFHDPRFHARTERAVAARTYASTVREWYLLRDRRHLS